MYLTYIKKVECHSAHSKCEICLHKGTETQSLECIHFFLRFFSNCMFSIGLLPEADG